MPPRYTYGTVILGGQPTAFRADTQEDLLPTLRQLQSQASDAVMMVRAGRCGSQEQARTRCGRDKRARTGLAAGRAHQSARSVQSSARRSAGDSRRQYRDRSEDRRRAAK